MKRYDPRRIACPYCVAEIGAWCVLLLGGGRGKTAPVEGFVHRERSLSAHRFRRAGAAAAGQRKLPGIE